MSFRDSHLRADSRCRRWKEDSDRRSGCPMAAPRVTGPIKHRHTVSSQQSTMPERRRPGFGRSSGDRWGSGGPAEDVIGAFSKIHRQPRARHRTASGGRHCRLLRLGSNCGLRMAILPNVMVRHAPICGVSSAAPPLLQRQIASARRDLRAWSELTRGGFQLTTLRGGHFFLQEARSELLRVVAERSLASHRLVSNCQS